jgi:hypothetical protein
MGSLHLYTELCPVGFSGIGSNFAHLHDYIDTKKGPLLRFKHIGFRFNLDLCIVHGHRLLNTSN